jgi:hypothetical protein
VWVIVVFVTGSVANHVQAADVHTPLDRHNEPPPRKVANLAYPVTTAATSSTDHLWTSPCRPERDGYFGGTSALSPTSLVVQYAFCLTTLPQDSGNLAPVLDTIRQRVADAVVSTAFPAVCNAVNRDLVSSTSNNTSTLAQLGITGFHFVPDYDAIGT